MKTKCEIVQKLLDEKKITAEDAVILLMGEKEYVYIPHPYPASPWPFYSEPFPYRITWGDTCGSVTSGSITVNGENILVSNFRN